MMCEPTSLTRHDEGRYEVTSMVVGSHGPYRILIPFPMHLVSHIIYW